MGNQLASQRAVTARRVEYASMRHAREEPERDLTPPDLILRAPEPHRIRISFVNTWSPTES
jgi:hypothetical protein